MPVTFGRPTGHYPAYNLNGRDFEHGIHSFNEVRFKLGVGVGIEVAARIRVRFKELRRNIPSNPNTDTKYSTKYSFNRFTECLFSAGTKLGLGLGWARVRLQTLHGVSVLGRYKTPPIQVLVTVKLRSNISVLE